MKKSETPEKTLLAWNVVPFKEPSWNVIPAKEILQKGTITNFCAKYSSGLFHQYRPDLPIRPAQPDQLANFAAGKRL
jgi:hypothetical protein